MSEKPTKVAVGQRWRTGPEEPEYTVRAERGGKWLIDGPGLEEGPWAANEILRDEYLGASEPTEAAKPARIGNTLYGVGLDVACPCGHRNGAHRPNQGGCSLCDCELNPFTRLMSGPPHHAPLLCRLGITCPKHYPKKALRANGERLGLAARRSPPLPPLPEDRAVKPCPGCGQVDGLSVEDKAHRDCLCGGGRALVECVCGWSGPEHHRTKLERARDAAIAAWNRRSPTPESETTSTDAPAETRGD